MCLPFVWSFRPVTRCLGIMWGKYWGCPGGCRALQLYEALQGNRTGQTPRCILDSSGDYGSCSFARKIISMILSRVAWNNYDKWTRQNNDQEANAQPARMHAPQNSWKRSASNAWRYMDPNRYSEEACSLVRFTICVFACDWYVVGMVQLPNWDVLHGPGPAMHCSFLGEISFI